MGGNQRRLHARLIATAFVKAVTAQTVCATCGRQPVEWHHTGHPLKPNSRVSSIRAQGNTIRRIQREMARCTPLCRRCHMLEDSRLEALIAKSQARQPSLPKSCVVCGTLFKPLRRCQCYYCYERHRVGGRTFKHELSDGCCGKWREICC